MKNRYPAVLLLALLIFASPSVYSQTVFSDNFDRASFTDGSSGGTPSTTYNFTLGNGTINTTLVSGSNYRLDINSGTGGGAAMNKGYLVASLAGYSAPFNVTLSSNNPAVITWTFNMRTSTAVTTNSPTQNIM